MGALEKTRQELDATKVRLSSTQKCLHERDGHLNQLQQERRKQLEEILEMKLVTHDLFAFRHLKSPVSLWEMLADFCLWDSDYNNTVWDVLF